MREKMGGGFMCSSGHCELLRGSSSEETRSELDVSQISKVRSELHLGYFPLHFQHP